MEWHVQYRVGAIEQVEMHATPERAIEAACKLIDLGVDVHGIGTGALSDSIAGAEIALIHAQWSRLRAPLGKR